MNNIEVSVPRVHSRLYKLAMSVYLFRRLISAWFDFDLIWFDSIWYIGRISTILNQIQSSDFCVA